MSIFTHLLESHDCIIAHLLECHDYSTEVIDNSSNAMLQRAHVALHPVRFVGGGEADGVQYVTVIDIDDNPQEYSLSLAEATDRYGPHEVGTWTAGDGWRGRRP